MSYIGGVKCPKFTRNCKALIYRIIPPISPLTRHIRGDTAGAGGRGYVYSPEGEGVLGGLWGTVIGYAMLSGMLSTR